MASDAYMEISDPDTWGEALDSSFGMGPKARREGAFEIMSFSFTATSNRPDDDDDPTPAAQPVAGTAPTRNAPAQRGSSPSRSKDKHPTVKEFTITKSIDSASGDLFLLCCQQKKSWGAVISFREVGDPHQKPWLILEFTDLYVDDFTWSLNPEEGGKGAETVKFHFGTICIKYSQQRPDGTHEPLDSKGWNGHTHTIHPPDLGSENGRPNWSAAMS